VPSEPSGSDAAERAPPEHDGRFGRHPIARSRWSPTTVGGMWR